MEKLTLEESIRLWKNLTDFMYEIYDDEALRDEILENYGIDMDEPYVDCHPIEDLITLIKIMRERKSS